MSELGLLESAATGMSVQRQMLDLAARNVAAAQAAVPGHPYQRLVASFAAPAGADAVDAGDDADEAGDDDAAAEAPLTVTHQAGTGDPVTELIAVLDAQRAYEANASIFDIGKQLAERTLDVDR